MSDGFTLHGSPHSLPTYRIALMLRLCRTSFTFRYVSFQRGMQLTPEFRAAILEYLAEMLGQFGAADVEGRQHLREWLFWDADRLMPPLYAWYSVELGRRGLLPISFDPVLVAEFDRKGNAALTILDAHLSGHRFLVGDGATIADICCYGGVAYARLSKKNPGVWPNVMTWAGRIEVLPGFAAPFDLLTMKDAEVPS
jgi:glutathione S-transferase